MAKSAVAVQAPLEPADMRQAPPVLEKLETARSGLAAIKAEQGSVALAAVQDKPGAGAAMAALIAKIGAAERDVELLELAYVTAAAQDRIGDAAGAVDMRDRQFAAFKDGAAARLEAIGEGLKHLDAFAACYSKYAIATKSMVDVLPSGTFLNHVGMGANGELGTWIGDLGALIQAEAWRLTRPDKQGRGARLPFAKPASWMQRDNAAAIPPAIDILTQAHDAVIADVEGQVSRLNTAAMTAAKQETAS